MFAYRKLWVAEVKYSFKSIYLKYIFDQFTL